MKVEDIKENMDLIEKLDKLWEEKEWDKVVMSFEKIMWDSYKNNKNKGYMLVHEWIRHAITPIILSIFEENQTVFHIILFSMFRV